MAKMENTLINECLNALNASNENRTFQTAATSSDDISGPSIACRFTDEAAKTLSLQEAGKLIQFLKTPKAGFENQDERIRPIATIRLLEEKGLSGDFVFGYDWHWRAEGSFNGRSGCPTGKWSRELRQLHDRLSVDLLEILHLPFVITGSSCTRQNLRKHLSEEAKSLEINLPPPVGVLRFDLDFRDGALRRLILHVHHPTAPFFVNGYARKVMATQIDAGINFFLWLLGKQHDPDTFQRRCISGCPRSRKCAPLAEMWHYVKKEAAEAKYLQLEEYSPSFLIWVCRYLQQDPTVVLDAKVSLAGAAANMIRKKISLANLKNSRAKRNGKRAVSAKFHGQPVRVLGNGTVKLDAPHMEAPLHFRLGHKEAKRIKYLGKSKDTRIYFWHNEIELRIDDAVVYSKPIERVLASLEGAEWLVQLIHELEIRRKTSQGDENLETQILHRNAIPVHNPALGAH